MRPNNDGNIDNKNTMKLGGNYYNENVLAAMNDMTMDGYSAVQAVLHWTKTVIDRLSSIQWRLIGYDRNVDGSTDMTKPIYNMTNPNDAINAIVQE
jgi:hypothetical protein